MKASDAIEISMLLPGTTSVQEFAAGVVTVSHDSHAAAIGLVGSFAATGFLRAADMMAGRA